MGSVVIVVPVYNVVNYVHRCISSILSQSFKEFELVLVDDGSDDGSGDVCDYYQKVDRRVIVIHQANSGLSAARNVGIEWALAHSDSEWITFIDSDDWVDERYLEQLYLTARAAGLSVAVGGVRSVDNDGHVIDEQIEFDRDEMSPEDLMVDFKYLGTWAVCKLYKKEDFIAVRYPKGKLFEDRHTTHKILFKYNQIAMVHRALYFYRCKRPGNIIGENHSFKNILDRIDGLRSQIDYFKENGFFRAENKVAGELFLWIEKSVRQKLSEKEQRELTRISVVCKNKYWKSAWRDCEFRYVYRLLRCPKMRKALQLYSLAEALVMGRFDFLKKKLFR